MRLSRFCIVAAIAVILSHVSGLPVSPQEAASTNGDPRSSQGEPEPLWSSATPVVDGKVRQLMQDRSFFEAVKAVDKASEGKGAPHDYLAYLKGRAFFLAGEHDAAIAVFQKMQEVFPDSSWLRRARFAAAVALSRKGDFRGAESIYRREVEYLFGIERKHEIAEVYLEFADAAFQPATEAEEPDYKKALTFYQQALDVGPKRQRRIDVELRVARCRQELGQTSEAGELYEQFSGRHADSPLDVEARYQLGECRMAEEDLVGARRAWQDLLAAHPDSSSKRIAEAMFKMAGTWQMPNPENEKQISLGVAALQAFVHRFPDHKLAPRAYLDMGTGYTRRKRYHDAVEVFTGFLADQRYAHSDEIAEVRCLLGLAYQLQEKYDLAIETWRKYLTKHPADSRWSAIHERIIDTEFLKGLRKFEAHQSDAARKLLGEFLAKYPLDRRCPRVLDLFGQINLKAEKFDEAIADWRRLVSKYPRTPEAGSAQFMIASVLENNLGRLEAALEEYRKVPWGEKGDAARQAAARLTAKELTVVTQRVFRSNEVPRIRVTTRNVESISVRVYKVDLQTYFRKMHRTEGVEGLDIALIAPDLSFDFEVPGYEKHREFDNAVEVPIGDGNEPGVTAVTVASKTLEATTLVIRSDLEVIIKSSRNEVFVFAQNMLTGKPWPNIRLLISDGQSVFAQESTGDDGVLQKTFEELVLAADVRVFAAADGHVASNLIELDGVGVATGLVHKGYIYTDRPAYRAGQEVRVRGCIRDVVNDAYAVPEGKVYTLTVLNVQNRPIHRETTTLGPYGTFHDRFLLPADSRQGKYRILVEDNLSRSYQGTFQVHEYKLEPIRLLLDSPRRVYYRGEKIEGTIRAEYYYGVPLVGHEIRYRLADDRSYTATTDEKGEVRFELSTREFYETQVLPLVFELPQRNLSRTENFFLTDRGFSVGLSTARETYTAGESFDVTVNCKDAEGKPAGRELTLRLFQRTTVDDKPGQRLVEEFQLKTDDRQGLARHTLTLPNGGRYLIRAEGTDRFGNPVSGRLEVLISGEEDQVRLRILADRHTYKTGETADVRVVWRERPALALVTFQGARVLDYRLVELTTGDNRLPIPMTAQLAPNFELDVAVMTDVGGIKAADASTGAANRFHQASSPFEVIRDLRVEISTRRKDGAEGPVEPGEDIEVTVTTTDPQGKPLSAEVGLAMVQQSLLDRFDWPMPPIGEFFRGQQRESTVGTTSSITFAYHPQTNPINPRLLSEAQRRELAREEQASLQAAYRDNMFGLGGMGGMMGGMEMMGGMGMGGGMGGMGGGMGGGGMGMGGMAGMGGGGMAGMADFDSRLDLLTDDPFADGPDPFADEPPVAYPDEKTWAELIAGRIAGLVEGKAGQFRDQLGSGRPDAETSDLLQETAYWNPSIITGDDGKATVTFTVPDRSTAWKLVAKAITVQTLAGEATNDLVLSKDFFAQMKLPLVCIDGDTAEVPVAIHNRAVSEGQIEVTLKITIGRQSVEQSKTIGIQEKGIHQVVFPVAFKRPHDPDDENSQAAATDVAFELTIAAGDSQDVVRRVIPLLPFGMQVSAAAGGTATSVTTAWVEDPAEMPLAHRSLQILVGPTVERSLLDAVLEAAPACQMGSWRASSALETATSDLMGALALKDLLRRSKDLQGPTYQSLDLRLRNSLAWLVAQQRPDGGWSWTGRGGQSNDFSTARAFWAIALARSAGYVVPNETYDKALAYLRKQVAATGNTDYEIKAILLHALSVAGEGDFALANRLHRVRSDLSAGALAYLAMAFVQMDRKETAAELVKILAGHDLDHPGLAGLAGMGAAEMGSLPWSQSPAELRALYALAIQEISPSAPEVKELAAWLMAHRSGHRWSPDKATGPAIMALAKWFSTSRFEGRKYRLAVTVNGTGVAELDVDPAAATQVIDVPGSLLKGGKQQINFQITGRGRYSYQCILAGFVPAAQLKSTTDRWKVDRTYQPAPLEVDGNPVARGFNVLTGTYQPFHNPLTQLPVARRGMVELQVNRIATGDTPDGHLEYLVLVDPIPSGTSVVDGSVSGSFDRYEVSPGAITFFIGNRLAVDTIRYELHGYLPGEYRMVPAALRNAHHPGQMALSRPASLSVLPLGAKSADSYRLTPTEMFELGKHFFNKGELAAARAHLSELIVKYRLRPKVHRATVQMLLDAHLKLGPADRIVHYFEIVKERWPDYQIPFSKVLKIAAAYDQMGEFERSYLVYRAMAEQSFLTESGLAGFLESQGEFARSVDVMVRLLREYPPESYIADATYALAQRVYAKASRANDDAELRAKKINRIDLISRATTMLDSFLTAYPDDPAADQAAFARASALLEAEAYDAAAEACERYANRYPQSDLLDAFWYVIGYCRFAMGQHQAAMDMCRKVAENQRVDKATGRTVPSPNKWPAIFILGQIHHSLGQAAEAVREYRRVEDRFNDAKRAIEYFLRKDITLPEVTTFRPDEPVEVELTFRNIAACDQKVYRIDLMKFGLLKRNLAGISAINLSGIRPLYEATVQLGDGKDYRDRTHRLRLPLKEEGVYLVVCRGDDLHASGLVLLTPLEVEVQTDTAADQVRVTVKDAVASRLLPDVHVKVIGSRNRDFVSGSTDLRGLFVADGINGSLTVIARAGEDQYAFYRAPARGPAGFVSSLDLVIKQEERLHDTGLDLGARGDAEKRIQAALASPTEIQVVDKPLHDVTDYFQDLHGITIKIDGVALEAVGIQTNEPVTMSISGVSLQSALGLILRDLDLTWTIRDEVLQITTLDEAESNPVTKIYPVDDFVKDHDDPRQSRSDFDSLINLVTSTVDPDTWEDVGGIGSVGSFTRGEQDFIVVRQTDDVHARISQLLSTIRGTGDGESDQALPAARASVYEDMQSGGFDASVRQRRVPRKDLDRTSTDDLLLERIMDANRRFQDRQMKQLDRMYEKGGGMGGAMGGGMGAGGIFE